VEDIVSPTQRSNIWGDRTTRAIGALAGFGAVVALISAWQVLDPGRAGADPQPAITRTSLGAAISLTETPLLQLTSYAQAAAVILLSIFAVQLGSRIGTKPDVMPNASVFVIGMGMMIAALFAVEFSLAIGLGETALARDDNQSLFAYFVASWWLVRFIGLALVCLMVVVTFKGVRGIALARTARWSTGATAAALLILTALGMGGFLILLGCIWVAAMSIGMAIDALWGKQDLPSLAESTQRSSGGSASPA